ncbi:unnamed protein product [Vitrella brassicaformis CCMP3155]|uniref:Uncharacterized protein n=1 Tax=Vitrella brassicaformis (strain CCMP3155) TaxID=1169540 RepID=A0A0G4ENG4_VITBC|nr:unnamed protein product [Vitrella brassicaformis CCMP3155]|eukprot:CEL99388.1 unnamed protein product [Vitrella brassicaformis CCMP3155]
MAASAAAQMSPVVRAQLLPQVEGYRTKQAQVNSCIDQLLQMQTTASMTPLMVDKLSRQFAAASEMLAELAETINSTIALTRHSRTQARRLHLTDIPANPMSVVTELSDLTTIAHLKSTARHFTNAVRPVISNIRLPKAIERAGVGGVVQFDDQLSDGDVMKAMWVVEEGGEGGWGEVADTLRFAEPFGCCQLPVTVGAVDLQTHATKADYSSLPRFCTQWMLVGRCVAFRRPTGQQDGTLQLFRHSNNEIRVICNEPGFTITLNPPLPQPNRPVHPFSQHPFAHHAKPHDPPVRHRIAWESGVGWGTVGVNNGAGWASASCMLKGLLLTHRVFAVGGFTYSPTVVVNRSACGGHLGRIMIRSPHTPLNGCSDVTTWEAADGTCVQLHLLTTSNDPFFAYIFFEIPPGNNQDVHVTINTTEAPAAGVPHDAPFAHRFRLTAAKVRRVLGPIAPIVLDGQAP